MKHHFDFATKLVVVGDSGSGKTSLLTRFVHDDWKETQQPTLGVEFMTRLVQGENHVIQLQLWDTAGQECFRAVTRGYYRGSAGAMVLFSLIDADSFQSVPRWLREVREVARPDAVIVLVGNKSDLADTRTVSREEASALAAQEMIHYFEVSALTGEGVERVFGDCVMEIERRMEVGPRPAAGPPRVDLTTSPAVAPVEGRCC